MAEVAKESSSFYVSYPGLRMRVPPVQSPLELGLGHLDAVTRCIVKLGPFTINVPEALRRCPSGRRVDMMYCLIAMRYGRRLQNVHAFLQEGGVLSRRRVADVSRLVFQLRRLAKRVTPTTAGAAAWITFDSKFVKLEDDFTTATTAHGIGRLAKRGLLDVPIATASYGVTIGRRVCVPAGADRERSAVIIFERKRDEQVRRENAVDRMSVVTALTAEGSRKTASLLEGPRPTGRPSRKGAHTLTRTIDGFHVVFDRVVTPSRMVVPDVPMLYSSPPDSEHRPAGVHRRDMRFTPVEARLAGDDGDPDGSAPPPRRMTEVVGVTQVLRLSETGVEGLMVSGSGRSLAVDVMRPDVKAFCDACEFRLPRCDATPQGCVGYLVTPEGFGFCTVDAFMRGVLPKPEPAGQEKLMPVPSLAFHRHARPKQRGQCVRSPKDRRCLGSYGSTCLCPTPVSLKTRVDGRSALIPYDSVISWMCAAPVGSPPPLPSGARAPGDSILPAYRFLDALVEARAKTVPPHPCSGAPLCRAFPCSDTCSCGDVYIKKEREYLAAFCQEFCAAFPAPLAPSLLGDAPRA